MGRPRKAFTDKLVSVSTSLPVHDYNVLCQVARADRKPLAELIREIIASRFVTEKTQSPNLPVSLTSR